MNVKIPYEFKNAEKYMKVKILIHKIVTKHLLFAYILYFVKYSNWKKFGEKSNNKNMQML